MSLPLLLLAISAALLASSAPALAAAPVVSAGQPSTGATQDASSQDTDVGPIFLLSLGGKLYDDLWSVMDIKPPATRNSALTGAASISSADTWRCVTCHGWDYSGAEVGGRKFPGLSAFMHGDPDAVKRALHDPAHPFPADALSDTAIDVLALFVTSGQYDRVNFISDSGQALGNPDFGRDIFEGACISCHQLDGRMFLRGEKGHATLGTVARQTPARALHHVLNGVPAAEMLSLRFLSEVQIADLLAYLQTLDTGKN